MNCKNCSAVLPEGAVFCTACGTKNEQPVNTASSVAVAEPVIKTEPINEKQDKYQDIPKKFKPLSPWAYFGYSLLYSVPIVGFIFLIIHAFSEANINRRNFTRSIWIGYLFSLILLILYFIIIFVVLMTLGFTVNDLANEMVYY